jgi:hypothetical protein
MIYLFDKCYLALAHEAQENSTHVWIGDFQVSDSSFFEESFNIYKKLDKITESKIDTLFADIQNNVDGKVLILCDVDNFLKIYGFFFGALLSNDGLNELYVYDRLKENYGISDTTNAKVKSKSLIKSELPENTFKVKKVSKFAQTVTNIRIELALINSFTDESLLQYCVDRITQMYKGSTNYSQQYVESLLPALIKDFSVYNLTVDGFIEQFAEEYKQKTYLLNKEDKLHEVINFDIVEHANSVVNTGHLSNDELRTLWESYLDKPKEQFVREFILNPVFARSYKLVFPNISNFDSVNPILWNKAFQEHDNVEWLEKFKLNYGTDNQTDRTV